MKIRFAYRLAFISGIDKMKVIKQRARGSRAATKWKKRTSLDALFFYYFIQMGIHPVRVVVRQGQDVILID